VNSGSGAYDNVVNQLLSMIDGVNSLNNILVIGMTNRKDLIDEAVLRPGRFEVHIEVGLPDESGRVQILNIHTEKLRSNNALDSDVKVELLAAQMKNYTGAEIEAVVKSASSFAFQRVNNIFDFAKTSTLPTNAEFKVGGPDFK
jgi:vesicle-fusing ATPase